MKKVLCTILILCVAVALLLPLSTVYAEWPWDDNGDSGYCGIDVSWEYDSSTSTLSIFGIGDTMYYTEEWYAKYIRTLCISAPLQSIAANAFADFNELTTVELPETIFSIFANAFSGCGMKYMQVPGCIIYPGAFQNCADLDTIFFSYRISHIHENAFRDCPNLEDIVTTADQIDDYAFAGGKKHRNLYILNSGCIFGQDVMTPATEDVTYTVYGFPGSTAEATFGEAFKPLCSCTAKSTDYTVTYPMCTEGGAVVYSCNICKESLEMASYPAGYHAYKENVVLQQPTCTEAGKKASVCIYCRHEKSSGSISALGHKYVDGNCSRCGADDPYTGEFGENISWEYVPRGQSLYIKGSGTTIKVPDNFSWDSFPVQKLIVSIDTSTIPAKAFYGLGDLIAVDLPDTVTTIEEEAFYGSGLELLHLPESVSYIGNSAFRDSQNLKNVILSRAVTEIGDYAFAGGSEHKNLYVLNPDCVFGRDVMMPGTAEGTYTVYGFLGSTAEATFGDAFKPLCACIGVSSDYTVAYPNCSEGGNVLYSCNVCGQTLDMGYSSQGIHRYKHVETAATCLEAGLKYDCCVYCNDVMNEAVIPALNHSFVDEVCIRCGFDDPYQGTCGENVLWQYDPSKQILRISGTGTTMEWKDTPPWDTFSIQTLEITTTKMSVLPPKAFYGHEELTKILLPTHLTHIGEEAFYGCGVESLRFPETLLSIGAGAFSYSKNLTSIQLPEAIESIESDAFRNCPKLTDIVLPASVKTIGDNAFAGVEEHINLYILNPDCVLGQDIVASATEGGTYTVYGFNGSTAESTFGEAFKPLCGCPGVSPDYTVIYPNCTEGGNIVYSCMVCEASLEMGNLPVEAHAYVYYAELIPPTCLNPGEKGHLCSYCHHVKGGRPLPALGHNFTGGKCTNCNIQQGYIGTWGENITWRFDSRNGQLNIFGSGELGTVESFEGAAIDIIRDNLFSVYVNYGITSICDEAFDGSEHLNSIVLPDTITSIGNRSFAHCVSLSNMYIPESVTYLGARAFYGCTSLSAFHFGGSGISEIQEKTFANCSKLSMIVLDVPSVDATAFAGCDRLTTVYLLHKNCQVPVGTFNPPSALTVWGTMDSTAKAVAESRDPSYNDIFKALCSCTKSNLTVHRPVLCNPGYTYTDCYRFSCSKCKTDISTERFPAVNSHTVKPDISCVPTCTFLGKNEGTCTRCYKYGEQEVPATGHVFTDGICFCGAHQASSVKTGITINHTLDLAEGIAINYVVYTYYVPEHEELFMECIIPVYGNNRTITGTKVVQLEPKKRDDTYYFTLSQLTAVNMADEVQATLFIKKDGEYIASRVDVYSISKYAVNTLLNSRDDNLCRVCANLIHYGEAAKKFKNYRTNHYPYSEMMRDEESRMTYEIYLTDSYNVSFGYHNTELTDFEKPIVKWVGKSLLLDSRISPRFMVDLSDYSGALEDLSLRVSYTDILGEKKTVVLENLTPYPSGQGIYAFTFDSLPAYELKTVLELAVFQGSNQVSNRLLYSPDTYCNGKTGSLRDLCIAMIAYSDCARVYFQN